MWIDQLALVLPDRVIERGAIRIEDGYIAAIRNGDAPQPATIHGAGLLAMPGLVDLHGDMIERELEPRPGSRVPLEIALRELDKRLAATGITTAYAALSFAEWAKKEGDSATLRFEEAVRQMIHEINVLRPTLLTDFRIHARFEITFPNAVPILEELIAEGQLDMVSLMDHTPGQGQYRDLESYISYMARWLNVDRRDVETSARELMEGQAQALQNLRAVGNFARNHSLTLASHDDDTVAKVALMAEVGATFSEFPITLEAAQAAKAAGMWVAMGGPNALRGASHSGNMSAKSVLQAGLLDILMTDYYPAAMLQAAFAWVNAGLLTLPAAAKLVADNPARAAGLHDRGRLVEGMRADLLLLKLDSLKRFPKIIATLRNGRFIYRVDY